MVHASVSKNKKCKKMISQQTKSAFYCVDIHKNGIIMAMIVGTILNCINQGPNVMEGEPLRWTRLILTYIVPYCVSVYSAVKATALSSPCVAHVDNKNE